MTVMSGVSGHGLRAKRPIRKCPVPNPQKMECSQCRSFATLPIARKFTFAFGIVCALCALQGALAIYGFVSIKSTVSDMVENGMPARRALGEIRIAIIQTRHADLALLLCATDECTATYKAKREKAAEAFAAGVREYTPLISHRANKPIQTLSARTSPNIRD